MSANVPRFYLRLGIPADKIFFQENKDLFYGVFMNARILESFPKSTAAFLNELGKPFIIDPDTYVFKLDPSMLKRERDLQVKRSYSELEKFYNSIITECFEEDRPLYPSDFLDSKGKPDIQKLDELSLNVIKYEKTRIDSLIGGLLRFIQEINAYPTILIPPYFDSSSINDPWFRISLELAKASVKYKDEYPLYPLICIDKSVLKSVSSINQLVKDYDFNGFDGYFVWFPDFNEDMENLNLLNGYAKLVKNLSIYRKPIIGMYGKFFSALLFYNGMSGFSSGINYWDKRSLEIAAGGPPYPRYYVPFLHTFLPWADVTRLFSEDPSLVCQCPACKQAPLGYQPSMEDIKRHFLFARYRELIDIASKRKDAMAKELLADYSQKSPLLEPLVQLDHLKRWGQVISAI